MSKCENCGKVFAVYGKPNQKQCFECRTKIEMPESFLERDQYDDTYDEMLWAKIEEKTYFEGQGYKLIKSEKLEM